MEPERNIEKELKAYAQQRRAAGGTPPELHPANRKALQKEAARLAKAGSGGKRPWWQSLFASWPRLAVAGAGVATVIIITLKLVSGPKFENEMAQNLSATRLQPKASKQLEQSEKESADAVNAPALAATPPAAKPMTLAAAPARKAKAPALEPAADIAPPVAVAAPAPRPAAPAVLPAASLLADAENRNASRDRGVASATSTSAIAPANHGLAGAPAQPALGILNSADRPATLITQPFRRTDLTRTSGKSTGVSNVLARFRVEQDLDKLRVIDSDGSVYLGSVAQTPETAKASGGAYKIGDAQKDAVAAAPADKLPQALRAYHFHVSGTNRTLKKEIVFTGNFLTKAGEQSVPTATSAPTEGIGGSIAPAGAKAESVLFELQKARMEGHLSLGGTNRFDINAVPVKSQQLSH